MIRQHRSVLHLDPLQSDGEEMVFIQPEEESLIGSQYVMPATTWERMLKPETITVTVQPGDLLNVVDPSRDPADFIAGTKVSD